MKLNLLIITLLLFAGLRWDVVARVLDRLEFFWWLVSGGCRGWFRYWLTRKLHQLKGH